MELCSGIEIDGTLLVSLACDQAFPLLKIHVGYVQADQFAYSHARGCENVHDGKIPQGAASVPQSFQIFVAQDFLSHYSGLHTVDAPYRAFDDIILVLKPREEA